MSLNWIGNCIILEVRVFYKNHAIMWHFWYFVIIYKSQLIIIYILICLFVMVVNSLVVRYKIKSIDLSSWTSACCPLPLSSLDFQESSEMENWLILNSYCRLKWTERSEIMLFAPKAYQEVPVLMNICIVNVLCTEITLLFGTYFLE